jgi:hypothetical protein
LTLCTYNNNNFIFLKFFDKLDINFKNKYHLSVFLRHASESIFFI